MSKSISFSKFAIIFTCLVLLAGTTVSVSAQDRQRVVGNNTESRPDQQRSQSTSRPVLTNKIVVRSGTPGVQKTSSSRAVTSNVAAVSSYMSATTRSMMMESIRSKMGIRYVYGTQGPYTYDCSGFVWKVFEEAGVPFTRTSAREFWRQYEPVSGDDRFEFGTLVFFNRLGHVGIVANEEGFYHASSSKGVTYSKFAGYWEKRIVGFRQIPLDKPTWNDERNQ